MRTLCGLPLDEYLRRAEEFHGFPAPGLYAGGLMVDLARRNFPDGKLYDVICETNSCLPDAVQLLTPCTYGNGWLRVIPAGRFALTFFDKHSGDGVRVSIDAGKLEKYPEIKNWFLRLKPKKEQDTSILNAEILKAGDDILAVSSVTVDESFLGHAHGRAISLCPSCGEAYPREDGPQCRVCGGLTLYRQSK